MIRLGLSGLAAVTLVLIAPAAAHAVLDQYREIDEARFSPAPLVPTRVPPSLRPIERSMGNQRVRSGRRYSFRLVKEYASGDAVLVFDRGAYRSMRAFLREHRRLGFKRKSTRIRGRRGFLMTRRLGPTSRVLAWREGGALYTIGSGTPRRVSLSQLRSTAAGLQHLRGYYFGQAGTSGESFADVALTDRTVTARVFWDAQCTRPGATEPSVRVGGAEVTLLRRRGNGFSFDIAGNRREGEEFPWTGTIQGGLAGPGVGLTVRASGTSEGDTCTTGSQSYSLSRVPRR
jgi:hypothetical protein